MLLIFHIVSRVTRMFNDTVALCDIENSAEELFNYRDPMSNKTQHFYLPIC
jgi:hypothetical protein